MSVKFISRKTIGYIVLGGEKSLWCENQLASPRAFIGFVVASGENISVPYLDCPLSLETCCMSLSQVALKIYSLATMCRWREVTPLRQNWTVNCGTILALKQLIDG